MDFDHSVSCSTTLNDEVSATGFPLGALGVAGRFGVGRSQWQKNARFLPEPRLLLIFSPHLLQILSTGMSGFIFYIPRLYGQKPLLIRSAIRTQLSQQHKLVNQYMRKRFLRLNCKSIGTSRQKMLCDGCVWVARLRISEINASRFSMPVCTNLYQTILRTTVLLLAQ